MTEQHNDYPHNPGYLYDCAACEASCHCTPGHAECVYEGEHKLTVYAVHTHASEYLIDTETTISGYANPDHYTALTVKVRMLPGLRYWERPDAATMRKWVDAALPEGWKRYGPREYLQGGEIGTWDYRYYIRKVA